MKPIFCIFTLTLITCSAVGQQSHSADDAYCAYIREQGLAQRALLRAPSAVAGPVQPSTGTPPQLVVGLTNSLADDRKSNLVMGAARTNCLLHKATVEAQQHIYYALPSVEKDVLRHRLDLIQKAADKLDTVISEEQKLVASQNMTRLSVYYLQAARVRLDMSRTMALTGITSPYVPPLSNVPLRQLIGDKLAAEHENQKAVTKLEKENGWDVKVSGGAHHQLGPDTNNSSRTGLFGEFSVTYDLGRHSAGNHFDSSVAAYDRWKANQLDDVASQAAVLKQQILDTISIQESQLIVLRAHDLQIQKDLQSLKDVDTSNSLSFKNQLIADQTVLRVDIEDVQFRIERLHSYIADNF